MIVYHQTGFRYNWNIDCYRNKIGDGIIYSPVNIDSDKLLELDKTIKTTGFLDPQLYLLNEDKGNLSSYPYFPGNIKPDFETLDLDKSNVELAKLCVDFQVINDFKYLVIPTRHNDENPPSFLEQSKENFVEPFCDYISSLNISKPILLSVIVKQIMITDSEKRDEILNWITGHTYIDGVYLIFENNFTTKQINNFEYLLGVLKFIRILKENDLEVHVGYTNAEAYIYSIAMPDSIAIGSYENLRSFGIRRFQNSEGNVMRSPHARLYSSKLFQWISYQYIEAMRTMIPLYEEYFDDSEFKPLVFSNEYNWHFNKSEPYKHYFDVFYKQIKALPENQRDRIDVIKKSIIGAIELFKEIQNYVLLDENSDGSHLPTWHNVVSAFEKMI